MVLKDILVTILVTYLLRLACDRSQVLFLFWKNAPHRLVKVNTFASHEIRFSDRIRSCEDVLMVESKGLAILACDPGRERWNTVMGIFHEPAESGGLYVFNYENTSASDDEALKQLKFVDFKFESDFHSLGVAYNESSSTLFVANHRHGQPAIEVFKLDLEEYTATHLRSVQHRLIRQPNSIALINDREFYVTNSHRFQIRDRPFVARVETSMGLATGTVVHVHVDIDADADASASPQDPAPAVRARVVARVPFANGIELLNPMMAAVASSSTAKIHLFSIRPRAGTAATSPPRFSRIFEFDVPFAPDNLSLESGTTNASALLIAGHPHLPSLSAFSATRHVCNGAPDKLAAADEATRKTCRTLSAPSWVARWTPDGGVETLYADVKYPSSSTAVRDTGRKIGIVSGLYAKGILVWRD
ncbi:putative six-bladed beta- -like protein [Rosellinia necatrix]|uniref:Putative six-bladed beta--like protein n=1 Tax=Rosellinia necatrix TaxID=77044 RepID=A0A1S7ULM0_ROSNE|nr:putative six-bladed beta- -like protein [Rosellinia necatrix]